MNNLNISETLNLIVTLQKNSCNNEKCTADCSRPFLGPTDSICYNTRPVQLFNCCTGTNWEFPYDDGASTIFRVENVDGNCATFRVLIPNDDTYSLSNSYFTIDLDCVMAIQCLPDIYVN